MEAISDPKINGEQSAVLANLALANQVFAANLRQQNALAHQQAVNHLRLAVAARCVSLILEARSIDDLPSLLMGGQAVLDKLNDLSADAEPGAARTTPN
jgi:hypothetical protein